MLELTIFRILAEANPCDLDTTGNCNGSGDPIDGFSGFIQSFVSFLFVIIGVVSVFVIIYAGFTMMTANGDAGKIAKGKKILIGAIIGLVISLLSYAIMKFVVDSL